MSRDGYCRGCFQKDANVSRHRTAYLARKFSNDKGLSEGVLQHMNLHTNDLRVLETFCAVQINI
jgi:hypothetical protein